MLRIIRLKLKSHKSQPIQHNKQTNKKSTAAAHEHIAHYTVLSVGHSTRRTAQLFLLHSSTFI